MNARSGIAENFGMLIRMASTVDEVDRRVSEVWQARGSECLTDAEAEQLSQAAIARRRDLNKIEKQAANFPTSGRSGRGEVQRPRSRPTLALPTQKIRVLSWIGGPHEFLSPVEAKRAFYLQRELWREQFTRDLRLWKRRFDLRVAWEISFRLNSDPTNERFGQCFASIATLAKILGCRQESFLASAGRLEDFGHLQIVHGRGRGNSNRYQPVIYDPRQMITAA